jgi:protein phosphatase PTC1
MLGNQNHKNNSSVDEDSPATIDPTASPQTTSPTSASTATTPPSTEASEPASPSLGTSPSSSWSERPLRKSSNRKNSLARDLIAAARNSMHGVYSTGNQQKESFKGLNDEPQMRNPGVCNNSAGESIPGPRSTFRVGVTEDRNKKCRKTMEDTHAFLYNFLSPLSSNSLTSPSQPAFPTSSIVAPENQDSDNGYFAIFDGHAGSYAADWCGRKLHVVLEETIRKNPDAPIPELLDMTFTNCDSQLEKLPVKNSGCTAVCAVLRWEDRPVHNSSDDGKVNANIVATVNENTKPNVRTERQRVLYTANVGDARIVMCRNGKALRLSYDHKGSDENEGKRVTNAGGLILNNRVNG